MLFDSYNYHQYHQHKLPEDPMHPTSFPGFQTLRIPHNPSMDQNQKPLLEGSLEGSMFNSSFNSFLYNKNEKGTFSTATPVNITTNVASNNNLNVASNTNSDTPLARSAPPYYSGEPDTALLSWIKWWDDYFAALTNVQSGTSSTQGMTLTAARYLSGTAAVWYKSVVQAYSGTIPEWSHFKQALTTMFEHDAGISNNSTTHASPANLSVPLYNTNASRHRSTSSSISNGGNSDILSTATTLHQDGSVIDYTNQFTRYWFNNSNNPGGDTLINKYIQGLDIDIRYRVAAKKPATLDEAIGYALTEDELLSETNYEQRQIGHDVIANLFNGNDELSGNGSAARPPQSYNQYSTSPQNPHSKNLLDVNLPKLTPERREQLRKLGGCFRCRQLGHQKDSCPLLAFGNNVSINNNNNNNVSGGHNAPSSLDTNAYRSASNSLTSFSATGASPNSNSNAGTALENVVGNTLGPSVPVGPSNVANINASINTSVSNNNMSTEPSLISIPKLTPEERERLRKFGGCYRCRRMGHQKENCPMNLTDLPPSEHTEHVEQDHDSDRDRDRESMVSN